MHSSWRREFDDRHPIVMRRAAVWVTEAGGALWSATRPWESLRRTAAAATAVRKPFTAIPLDGCWNLALRRQCIFAMVLLQKRMKTNGCNDTLYPTCREMRLMCRWGNKIPRGCGPRSSLSNFPKLTTETNFHAGGMGRHRTNE